jgi:hypothetical protein
MDPSLWRSSDSAPPSKSLVNDEGLLRGGLGEELSVFEDLVPKAMPQLLGAVAGGALGRI